MRRRGAAWAAPTGLLAIAALLSLVLLTQAVAASRPPAPAGAIQLSPGQLPRTCTTAEHDAGAATGGTTYGYYFSKGLLLSLAGIIGRRVLFHDLGSGKALTIASASARVPARGTRRLKLKASALGGRALRILALSPKGAVRLTVSSRGRSRSRAIEIG